MKPVKATTRKLWKKGYSVSGWARENGFVANSVFQILSGTRPYKGTRGAVGQQIRAALIRDGIIKKGQGNGDGQKVPAP